MIAYSDLQAATDDFVDALLLFCKCSNVTIYKCPHGHGLMFKRDEAREPGVSHLISMMDLYERQEARSEGE